METTTCFTIAVTDVCNLIAFLFASHYSSNSIASHLSAISYIHEILNIHYPTQAFVAKKILKGCQSLNPSKDSQLSITPEILQKILNALEHTVSTFLHRCLLKALFQLSFHAFLRLGEITTKSPTSAHKVLQRSDVQFEYKDSVLRDVQIVKKEFKTNKNHTLIVISLQANGGFSVQCKLSWITLTCQSTLLDHYNYFKQ